MSGIHLFLFQLLFELMISNCFDMDNTIEATDAIFVLICSHKVGSHVVWFPNQKKWPGNQTGVSGFLTEQQHILVLKVSVLEYMCVVTIICMTICAGSIG